jgi:transposase, IS6 family
MSGTSFRVDETYIKVGKSCKYLYRAVDKEGQTIEFMLSAKRDVCAAKRFFKKMMRAEHRRLPLSISVDKNAAYPRHSPLHRGRRSCRRTASCGA